MNEAVAVVRIQALWLSPLLMLSLQEPVPEIGVVHASNCGGSVLLSVSLYLYGDDAPQIIAKQESAWQEWLNESFPTPVPSCFYYCQSA